MPRLKTSRIVSITLTAVLLNLSVVRSEPPPAKLNLDNPTAETVAGYSLSSPQLKFLYEQVFLDNVDMDSRWRSLALDDLVRRGLGALPLLLQCFYEEDDNFFRDEMLGSIDGVSTLPMEPFVEACRILWKRDGFKLRARTCGRIAHFLDNYGEAEDLHILEEMQQHPDGQAGYSARLSLKRMKRRLAGELKPKEWGGHPFRTPKGYDWGRPPMPSLSPAVTAQPPVFNPALVKSSPSKEAAKVLPVVNTGNDSSWIVWLLAVFAGLAGVFWLLRKPSKQV